MQMPDVGGAAVGAAAMKSLKKAAADGRFAVSETGGEALLQAFREMKQWVDDNRAKLDLLAQQPQLGGSNGADTMKPFAQNVATDQQGFITMLLQFRDSLEDGEQGVRDAMNNYRTLDYDTAQPFSRGV